MNKAEILLVSALVLSGLSLGSCAKKTTDDSSASVKDSVSLGFVVAVMENQFKYFDQAYEVSVNGVMKSFTLSQMTEVSLTEAGYKDFVDEIQYELEHYKITGNMKIYKYDLGTLRKGQKAVAGNKTFTPKPDRPSDAKINVIDAYVFSTDGVVTKNMRIYCAGGLHNTEPDFSEWCELKSDDMSYSYSL